MSGREDPSVIVVKSEARVRIPPTKGDLVRVLESLDIPDDAKPTVYQFNGDQRDPSYTEFVFQWEKRI